MSVAILGITITGLPEPDVTGNISVNTERFAKIETEIKSQLTEVKHGKKKLTHRNTSYRTKSVFYT